MVIVRQDTPLRSETGIGVRRGPLRHLSRALLTRVNGAAAQTTTRLWLRMPAAADRTAIEHDHRSAGWTPADETNRHRLGGSRPMTKRPFTVTDAALRAGIVGLTLATAYIHSTLGGMLFTLNAMGYVVAAAAMVAPIALASRFRWFIRLGLMGYAATTIVGWAIQGPYYSTAYVAKAIEAALIVLLAVDFARFDGNPVAKVRNEIAGAVAYMRARRTGLAGA
jgi:hypothetical protein